MVLTSVCLPHLAPGSRKLGTLFPIRRRAPLNAFSASPGLPGTHLPFMLSSIPASHTSADPSLQTLAVVGLENGEADPSPRVVAQTCNNPGKGSLGGSCTCHKLAGPEVHQCAVHSGAMWSGSFLLFPSPRTATSAWIQGGSGLRRQVLEDSSGASKQLLWGP